LEDEADRALGALTADDDAPAEPPTPLDPRAARVTIRGASADLLRAAGIPVTSPGAPARAPAPEREGGEGEARERADALARRLEEAERAATGARARNEAAQAHAREIEAQLANAVGRARKAEAELAAAARRVEEAEASVRRAEDLARRVEELEGELATARGEVEGARAEAEKRTADLRRRVQELETTSAKHEERVLKAYQKIKGDERLREKTRKALAIALQLLDEGAPAADPGPAEKKLGGMFGRD
ncbi:MAG TPA: response regulator, partial [Anaeromyxobacter sp.]